MSKAELTQKTKDEICKAVKFCSGSFPVDSDSIEPYVYRILDIWEQYAEQESREVAVKWRTESVISDKDSYYEILEESYKLYDDWKSKQEEKP